MGHRLRALTPAVWGGPVIYPFLFAAFPILFIWAHNVGEFSQSVHPLEIFVPLGISIGFTALVLVPGSVILRDIRKAGLLVLLFLLSFYFYGHVYTSLQNAGIGDPSRQWLFSLAWASGFLSTGVVTLMFKSELRGLTNYLNVAAALMIIFPLVNLGIYTFG